MGASYGSLVSTNIESWTNPEVVPKMTDKPKHDANFGFSNERASRGFSFLVFFFDVLVYNFRVYLYVVFQEIKVSEEEMYWANIPPNKRDYCAQFLIELTRCRKQHFPFLAQCAHHRHDWDNCQNEE